MAQESTHIPLPRTSCTVQLYLQGSLGNRVVLFAQREETEAVGVRPVPDIGWYSGSTSSEPGALLRTLQGPSHFNHLNSHKKLLGLMLFVIQISKQKHRVLWTTSHVICKWVNRCFHLSRLFSGSVPLAPMTKPLTALMPGCWSLWAQLLPSSTHPLVCSQTHTHHWALTWLEQSAYRVTCSFLHSGEGLIFLLPTMTCSRTPQWTRMKQPKFLSSRSETGWHQSTRMIMQIPQVDWSKC